MATKRKGRASRNHKGCGICKPYKRVGNGKGRYPHSESGNRVPIKEEIATYNDSNELHDDYHYDEDKELEKQNLIILGRW